jgi:hypothetical protein
LLALRLKDGYNAVVIENNEIIVKTVKALIYMGFSVKWKQRASA